MVAAGIISVIIGLALITGSVVALFHIGLPRRLRELRAEVTRLSARVAELESSLTAGVARDATRDTTTASAGDADSPTAAEAGSLGSVAADAPTAEDATDATSTGPGTDDSTARDEAAAGRTAAAASAGTPRILARAERGFADYWLGILGVLALVVGFGFLAILTALDAGAFSRYLMLVAGGGVFFLVAEVVARRGRNVIFAGWFYSAAGAMVVLASVGTITVPWLRWVVSAPQGYAVLAAGVVINVFVAFRRPHHVRTSFHTVVSLAALSVVPAHPSTIITAVIVVVAAIIYGIRREWSFHLLVAETAFFAFTTVWLLRAPTGFPTDVTALSALIVALTPIIAAPYLIKRDYSSDRTTRIIAGTVRIAAWLYLAVGVAALGRSFDAVSVVFVLFAVAAYLPGRFTTRVGTAVLRTDRIATFALVVAATLGLTFLELAAPTVLATATVVSVITLLRSRTDRSVRRSAAVVIVVLAVLHLGATVATAFTTNLPGMSHTVAFAVMAMTILVCIGIDRGSDAVVGTLCGAALSTVIVGAAFAPFVETAFPQWVALGGAVALPLILGSTVLGRTRRIPFVRGTTLIITVGLHVATLIVPTLSAAGLPSTDWSVGSRVAQLILLALYTIVTVALGVHRGESLLSRFSTLPAVFLGTVDLAATVVVATDNASGAVGVTLWFLLSAAGALLRSRVDRIDRQRIVHRSLTAAGITLAIVAATVTITLATSEELAPTAAGRAAAYVIGTATLVLWSVHRRASLSVPRFLSLYTALVFAVVTATIEVGFEHVGVVLTIAALTTLSVGVRGPTILRHLRLASVFLFWIALFAVVTVGSESVGDVPDLGAPIDTFSAAWWRALTTAFLTTLYVAGWYRLRPLRGTHPNDGPSATRLNRLVDARRGVAILVPFFLSVAVFFFLVARGPVLTTLLILEGFVVFATAIVLAEAILRATAYLFTVVGIVRLIFFDMAEADTIERAIVFLVAGAVLLGMNWMHTVLRRRYEVPIAPGKTENASRTSPTDSAGREE